MSLDKYEIIKLDNFDKWNEFELGSPQSSIFSSLESIEFYKDQLDIYRISKGAVTKSIVYLYSPNKRDITPETLIYSGILFSPQKLQKEARYIAEKHTITKCIIEKILMKYDKINLNLHYNIEDIRPFAWHNYHKTSNEKFQIEVRYTALININNENLDSCFSKIDDIKQRDIKKCLKDKDISFDYKENLNDLKIFYYQTMKKNNGEFNKEIFEKNLNFLEILNSKKKGFQTNITYKGKTIYSSFFSIHNNVACYLYGAGDINFKNRYAGTYCLWKSLEFCLERKLNSIDLEGVNSPQRGSFKLSFGSKLKPYFNISYQ